MAAHLDITLEELFQTRLRVDWWESDGDLPLTFVLSPATTVRGSAGAMCPAKPTGCCVLFVDDLCSVHPVKPFECRAMQHGDTSCMATVRRLVIARQWVGHQVQIRELLGSEPVAVEYNIFDAFGLG